MKEKAKNTYWSQHKWGIRIVLLLLIVVSSSCLWLMLLLNAMAKVEVWFENPPPYDLEGQEARDFIGGYPMYLGIPTSASAIYLHYLPYDDYMANIRFSDRPENIEAWIEENDFCFTDLSPNRDLLTMNIEEFYDWWTPNEGEIRVTSMECGNNPYFQISIDQSNPELWIVYLITFQY